MSIGNSTVQIEHSSLVDLMFHKKQWGIFQSFYFQPNIWNLVGSDLRTEGKGGKGKGWREKGERERESERERQGEEWEEYGQGERKRGRGGEAEGEEGGWRKRGRALGGLREGGGGGGVGGNANHTVEKLTRSSLKGVSNRALLAYKNGCFISSFLL